VRTVSGFGRQVVRLVSWFVPQRPASAVRLATTDAVQRPLLSDRLGEQRHAGAVLDQVDGTTCGSAVLVALAAWADPTELARLEATPTDGRFMSPLQPPQPEHSLIRRVEEGSLLDAGFGARFDARQKQVHRETNRFWPQALGTTPWGAVRWLRDHVPAAGRHRVRLVDDTSAADVARVVAHVEAALTAGRPVPLLVGSLVPRHYVLAVGVDAAGWRVYEPTSAQVRVLDLAALRERRLGPVLGFDRLHAVLLPT
jgi:hypothetical protein